MEKKIDSLVGQSVRSVLKEANKMGLAKEDIISVFSFEGQVFLVYIK